jgi:hypothetical protein
MKNRFRCIPIAAFLLVSLACSAGAEATATATPDSQLATDVAATLVAMATPTGTPAPSATATSEPPTETPAPGQMLAALEASCPAARPVTQSLPAPVGIAVGLDENIALYDLHGALLADRPATGMTLMRSEFAHLAGGLAAGADNLPIVYHTLQGGGILRQNVNNEVTDVLSVGDLPFLAGAEGRPFVVYTTIDLMHQWANSVFAGDPAELPEMSPRMTWTQPEGSHIGNVIRPLAVHTEAGNADGFWYTYTMVGIGNVNYPPYNGLFFYDLETGESTEYLPTSAALGGISPDQTLAAYGPGQGGYPGVIRDSVTIRNLITCQEVVIPFNPASNLGGGWMVFSPDGRNVAWTEADGPSNMEANFRLRVARTSGESLFDSPIPDLGGFLGGESPAGVTPAAWAANHILAMNVWAGINKQSLVTIWGPDPAHPIDPALGAHQSIPLAEGDFIGLLYP